MPITREYDIGLFNEWYREARDAHDIWYEKAEEDWSFYIGNQWDQATVDKLTREKRPRLTLNYIRRLVRLLVGYEMRTRYDMKVLPTGEYGDDGVARLLTKLIKYMERMNNSDFIYSGTYKYGLVTGRGWIGTRISRDENILGDAVVNSPDPNDILVDPYGKRPDLMDHKYQIVEKFLELEGLLSLYPEKKKEILDMPTGSDIRNYATEVMNSREYYRLREFWYRRYDKKQYLLRLQDGELFELKTTEDIDNARERADGVQFDLVSKVIPRVYYSTYVGDVELESGPSPYLHKYYPNVPFFCEFIPKFGSIDADWVGVVRDLIDPQKEVNKRRSEFLDILIRVVNTGWIYEEGSLKNPGALKEMGVRPGVEVETVAGMFDRIREKKSGQPAPALFEVGARSITEIMDIAGINPAMMGIQETSREPAAAIMARRQQGNVMIAPYQDNMRLTRYLTSKILLSMVPMIFSPTRIGRIIGADGTVMSLSQEEFEAVRRALEDVKLGRYDIEISDTPQTPTQRVAEFIEMKEIIEMMAQFDMPPTPGMLQALVQSSDVSQKRMIVNELQTMQQAMQNQAAQ